MDISTDWTNFYTKQNYCSMNCFKQLSLVLCTWRDSVRINQNIVSPGKIQFHKNITDPVKDWQLILKKPAWSYQHRVYKLHLQIIFMMIQDWNCFYVCLCKFEVWVSFQKMISIYFIWFMQQCVNTGNLTCNMIKIKVSSNYFCN